MNTWIEGTFVTLSKIVKPDSLFNRGTQLKVPEMTSVNLLSSRVNKEGLYDTFYVNKTDDDMNGSLE